MLECEDDVLRAATLENIKQEMIRLIASIVGISETRWRGQSNFYSDGFRGRHSVGEESQRAVAVILDKRTAQTVESVCYEGDGLLMVHLRGKQTDVLIVEVYMPASDYNDIDVEDTIRGLGITNKCGEKLVEFCKRWKLYIANTWFCQAP